MTVDRLLLVDGSNLLFQMFFGMPARIVNHQGKAIQGTLGFTGALLKIIRMVQPTHTAVLFDGEHATERTEINPDYKAKRPDYSQTPDEETPFSQLADVYAALDYMGIRHAETTSCETDDWIASYVHACGQTMQIVISSFDSDFYQLIGKNVSVLRYRGDRTSILTPDSIQCRFGISPEQYADFKALTGDPADNIRGAEKVGPKTAAALLQQFGTLERILACADGIAKPAVRSSILRNHDRLLQNRQLIFLTGNVPFPFSLDELLCPALPFATREVLKGIHLQ